MLVASIAAAALAAAATAPVRHVVVNVAAAQDVPAAALAIMRDEASAIWRDSGVELTWHAGLRAAADEIVVVVGGVVRPAHQDGTLPLGWIVFDDPETPTQQIYLSRASALDLIAKSSSATGGIGRMPPLERDAYLGRAMGRALAHELGHYLLGSKAHTETGLMKASHTAWEFFSLGRVGFGIDAAQRAQLDVRLSRTECAATGIR
jgi:hypothetical protein